MSFKLNKRRLSKIYNRLRQLPSGFNFLRYSANKAHALYLKATGSTKVAYPSSIMLEVTNHCNLACITCPREYGYGANMDKGTINEASMFKVIDEVAPFVDSIGLTGLGETLLYKKLEETLKYIKSKNRGIQTFISTNAHLPVAEDYIERIAPYLDTVQISIDGVGKGYEQVRLLGNYDFFLERTKNIVEVCAKHKLPVMFNFVIVRENFRQMKEVVSVASQLGVTDVNLTPVNLSSITHLDASYYEFFHSGEFLNELESAHKVASASGNVQLTMWDIKSKNEFQKCHLPWNHFYISWNGWMTPCCAKPFPKELNFGNVFETSLMKCLNSPEYRQFRNLWLKNLTPDFCRKCHMIDLPPIETSYPVKCN